MSCSPPKLPPVIGILLAYRLLKVNILNTHSDEYLRELQALCYFFNSFFPKFLKNNYAESFSWEVNRQSTQLSLA